MDYLWTPWRFQYIASGGEPKGCVFCAIQDESQDDTNLVLLRRSRCFVILNRFPYTAGHLMIVASRHISSPTDADDTELTEMILTARLAQSCLIDVYRPDGFNIGFNVGKSAGAGIASHLHLHVVPRWHGDANFVSILGETRVLPEDLKTTFGKLKTSFRAAVNGS